MTALAYYDKDQQKEPLQLPEHRDNVFGPTGAFLDKKNTEGENTATVVVSLGDTMKLRIWAYLINCSSYNNYKMANGVFTRVSIDLPQGLLFDLV